MGNGSLPRNPERHLTPALSPHFVAEREAKSALGIELNLWRLGRKVLLFGLILMISC
jgi:hypothetical protein